MFKRIDHIECSQDFDRSHRLLWEVLGFKVKSRQHVEMPPLKEVAYLELGDTVLELMRVRAAAGTPADEWHTGYRMIALEVDDMDKAVAYLTAKGVAITWGPLRLWENEKSRDQRLSGNLD